MKNLARLCAGPLSAALVLAALTGCEGSPGGSGSAKPQVPSHRNSPTHFECSAANADVIASDFEGARERREAIANRVRLWGAAVLNFGTLSNRFPVELLSTEHFVEEFHLQPEDVQALTHILCDSQ